MRAVRLLDAESPNAVTLSPCGRQSYTGKLEFDVRWIPSGGVVTQQSRKSVFVMSISPAIKPSKPQSLLPIALQTLRRVNDCDFDLFHHTGQRQFVLYRAQGIALGFDEIDRLIAAGVKALYISAADQEAYSAHLERQILSGEELPVADRYQLLQATTRCVLENAFSDADVGRLVEVTTKFSQHLTDTLCAQSFLMGDLFTLMVHDYFTFHHAMNVSTYCVALALELGISSKEDLVAIASGGLLHDIGKRGISPAVLGKTGQLDDEERELMRRHAQWGFEALSSHANVNWGQLMMVYQHHERTDGSGYPVGVLDGDIHAWAKICAVADVFDALTCDRPYRKAMTVAAGLSFLQRHAGVSFDKEIVECLTKTMRQK